MPNEMNSKNNMNTTRIDDKDLLDSKGRECQPRYPFAEAPDVMNPIEKIYTRGQSANISNATSTTIDVTSQILRGSKKLAGSIIKVLIKILWPKGTQQEWENFMDAVEQLIHEKLDTYARNKATADLEGLQRVLSEYIDKLTIYTDDPNAAHAQSLRTQVITTDNLFEYSMPSFAIRDYEMQLLTVYAQAANLHLAFLEDIVRFGDEWGFTPAEIADFHKSMKERTDEYTNHCVSKYNKGLEKAKLLTADLCNHSTYPWTRYNQGWRKEETPNCSLQQIDSCEQPLNESDEQGTPYMGPERRSIDEYQKLENWNLYNAYRRDVTLMVLDIVSLWPTYDPKLYPTSYGVTSELTRELYTDIRGTTYRSDESQNSLDAIEGRMIPQPSLFRWLFGISIKMNQFIGTGGSDDWTSGNLMLGMRIMWRKTLTEQWEGLYFGGGGNLYINLNPLDYAEGITHVNTRQWFEPRWFEFYSGGYDTELKFQNKCGTIEEKSPFWAAGPYNYIYQPGVRTSQIPEHRLSWMTYEPVRENAPFVYPQYKQLGAVALGWTSNSVDQKNAIDLDKITSLPAVKGNEIRGPGSVVRGPGSTGGNLVLLNPTGEVSITVSQPILNKPGAGYYHVRIRYAAIANGKLNVKRSVNSSTQESVTYDYKQTTARDLTYSSFQYLEVYDFNPVTTASQFEVLLTNESGGPIYIDKIEFIPFQGTTGPEAPGIPADIYYTISPAIDENYYTIGGSTIWLSLKESFSNPPRDGQWRFVYDTNKKAYQIGTQLNEDPAGGLFAVLTSTEPNNNLTMYPNLSLDQQYWFVKDAGDGYVTLENYGYPGYVVNVPRVYQGAILTLSPFIGSMNHKFKLTKLSTNDEVILG
ncbi:insecticidal delta-endotoxin Cry8Ea1 family protein [Bacillus toyonensis]|nr:insecticidal delta-endotoxin Cry8Ea1 family protein [Bacillus toyonensis]